MKKEAGEVKGEAVGHPGRGSCGRNPFPFKQRCVIGTPAPVLGGKEAEREVPQQVSPERIPQTRAHTVPGRLLMPRIELGI